MQAEQVIAVQADLPEPQASHRLPIKQNRVARARSGLAAPERELLPALLQPHQSAMPLAYDVEHRALNALPQRGRRHGPHQQKKLQRLTGVRKDRPAQSTHADAGNGGKTMDFCRHHAHYHGQQGH